jgi:hypothetical protein
MKLTCGIVFAFVITSVSVQAQTGDRSFQSCLVEYIVQGAWRELLSFVVHCDHGSFRVFKMPMAAP